MNREEQKASNAKKYYPEDINCYYAFLHGAEWADKHPVNVWHDASEEPDIGSNIVAIDKDGRLLGIQPYDDDYDRFGLEGWRRCVYLYNDIQKWAYISDLLPKGGGE